MSVDVQIQPERADHPQVIALLEALDRYLGGLYAPEANHILSVEELLAPEVSFFAAWHDDRVVGTGASRRMPGYGEIKRMYVDPGLRGQRLGSRLVTTLEDAMRAQGLTRARLETGEAQREAVRLYERCGYRRCDAFGGYPDNGLSLFYERQLAPPSPLRSLLPSEGERSRPPT